MEILYDDIHFCTKCDTAYHTEHLITWLDYQLRCSVCYQSGLKIFYPKLPELVQVTSEENVEKTKDLRLLTRKISYQLPERQMLLILMLSLLYPEETQNNNDWGFNDTYEITYDFVTSRKTLDYWRNVDRPPPSLIGVV